MQSCFRRARSFVAIALPAVAMLFVASLLCTDLLAQDATAPKSENLLVKTWNALGTMYAIIFLVMSIVLVALVVRALLAVQKNNFVPDDLIQGVDASLGEKNAQAAVELVRADESFLGQVVAAGLGKLQGGKDSALQRHGFRGARHQRRIRLSARGRKLPLLDSVQSRPGSVRRALQCQRHR